MRSCVAIVQARMGASRLPNKMMLHLHGYPVIEWVRRRCLSAQRLDALVFALPDTADNDVLHDFLAGQDAHVFRGSELDVLDRYYQAAMAYGADDIVRVCADNPLVSGSEIDRLIDFFHVEECDYAYNHVPKGNLYPDGLGAEIAGFELVERMQRDAREAEFREHVFNYIHAHPGMFSIRTFNPPTAGLRHPELRLDLDTIDDYRRLMQCEVGIDMSAEQVVEAVLEMESRENT